MKPLTRFLRANRFTGPKHWHIDNKDIELWNDESTGTTLLFTDDMKPSQVIKKIDDSRQKFKDAEK